jgi:hypothetical protein
MIPQDRGGGGYRYQMVNIREANILWREMQTARSGSAANPRFKGLKCLESSYSVRFLFAQTLQSWKRVCQKGARSGDGGTASFVMNRKSKAPLKPKDGLNGPPVLFLVRLILFILFLCSCCRLVDQLSFSRVNIDLRLTMRYVRSHVNSARHTRKERVFEIAQT